MKKPKLTVVKNDVQHSNKRARDYIQRGWSPIPIPPGSKGPTHKNWGTLQIDLNNVDEYFPRNAHNNIGILLGPKSGDLTDVDLDCTEAIALAPYMLPGTGAVFGRHGKQRSHYLYYVHDAKGQAKAAEAIKDVAKGMIVELRLGVGGRAAQTVFPGSVHTSGEKIEWAEDERPATITLTEALRSVKKLGAAVMLMRAWPDQGSRHEAAFIVGAFLARAGWEREEIIDFVAAVSTEAGDVREIEDRKRAAAQSADNTIKGERSTYGLPKMQEMFGVDVVNHVAKILDYSIIDSDEQLERMNEQYCIVSLSGKIRVMEFDHNKKPVFYGIDDFKAMLNNQRVGKAGRASWWLNQAGRRQYKGLVFKPEEPAIVNDCLNLWQGWGIAPAEGCWQLMRSHMKEILAAEDEAADKYLLQWTAWTFQNPGKPAEVAIVLRGGKGTGKGIFARSLKAAFGLHGLQISSIDHLAGHFNQHLLDCALLFADEAYWPGDKKAEGTFKRLLTEPTLFIEPKGLNPFEAGNSLHVVMGANADWVVPATADERRYAVFNVSDKCIRNIKYFKALYNECDHGGIAAMMHDLLHMDLDGWHPRYDIPQNAALYAQQMMSLAPLDQWWQQLLDDGLLPGLDVERRVPSQWLFKRARDNIPMLRNVSDVKLGDVLKLHGCEKIRLGPSIRGWRFPPLAACRAMWSRRFPGQQWNDVEDWTAEDEAM